ncbi:MAG: vanadium-dependent haloperoxidase [Waddliaceae bacterium]
MNRYLLILTTFLSLAIYPMAIFGISNDRFFRLARDQRRVTSHTIKSAVGDFDLRKQWPKQTNNGDEKNFENLRGNFGKALSHFSTGYIIPNAYQSLIKALQSGKQEDFDSIQLGIGLRKLVSPQASFAFSLSGTDGWRNTIPPAPAFASAQTAGEMVELYWTVICRDIDFNDFEGNPDVLDAVAELNTLTDFRGPKNANGMVTPGTFLRGNSPGDLIGPYISQFLYLPIPYGTGTIAQEQIVPAPNMNDFNFTFNDWFTVINGGLTGNTTIPDDVHFIRNPRDLTEYVHTDFPGQEGVAAIAILSSFGPNALDPANPYRNNPTQEGFVTFGQAQVLDLMQKAVQEGLKAAWYHKWQVNRRLRPEEYGFYVQQQKDGAPLGINPQLINSNALTQIFDQFGTYFLPVAYPEGSPAHPAYPAGHAAFIGATATILKAFFNENFVIPQPLEPDDMNMNLIPYTGLEPLTVGNELNKLAANIALGRDHAGVHYRSDGCEGILLGEKIAIDVLNNESFLFNENFKGFTLTTFGGATITVGQKRNP